MTAVETCPACGRSPKRTASSCRYCGAAFDREIVPPPVWWPRVLWWLLLVALFLVPVVMVMLWVA